MKSCDNQRALFLLRTYNDIDHIIPIIWKAVTEGWRAYFVFVDKDYSNDYRIKFITAHGARSIRSVPIEWYHTKVRRLFKFRIIRRAVDRLVAYFVGLFFLLRYRINIVANEWSGPFGREQAEYYLRAAGLLNLPVYSLPHGFFLWLNPLFNKEISTVYMESGKFPDFSNRNWFEKYIVQSPEHKAANIEYGMDPNKLVILGSARFCKEWSAINYRLLCEGGDFSENNDFTVLFFLPHWDYNVYRDRCISLLEKISKLNYVRLEIKTHTRGTGALDSTENNIFQSLSNVRILDDSVHSTLLIKGADVVVNCGSSVAFEALRQRKLVINPMYLHDNSTFFDYSRAVVDAIDEKSTLKLIIDAQSGHCISPQQTDIDEFLHRRVDGNSSGHDVLQSYINLLSGD